MSFYLIYSIGSITSLLFSFWAYLQGSYNYFPLFYLLLNLKYLTRVMMHVTLQKVNKSPTFFEKCYWDHELADQHSIYLGNLHKTHYLLYANRNQENIEASGLFYHCNKPYENEILFCQKLSHFHNRTSNICWYIYIENEFLIELIIKLLTILIRYMYLDSTSKITTPPIISHFFYRDSQIQCSCLDRSGVNSKNILFSWQILLMVSWKTFVKQE